MGRYRKMFPFLPYEAGVEYGSEFCVFDVPEIGRFGVSICYDIWFPETSRMLTALGAEVLLHPVLTNTVDRDVELAMARATASVERERFLLQRLTMHPEPVDRFVAAFFRPPLFSTAFERGFGTLYTSEIWPAQQQMTLHWPGSEWRFRIDDFCEGQRRVRYATQSETTA